jgi:hypothetical protein
MIGIPAKIAQPLRIAFSLAFAAGLVYVAYLALMALNSLDASLKSAVIAAVVAFGVTITSNIVQKKRELEFKIRERKVEAYQIIFEFMNYFIRSAKLEEGANLEKLIDFFYKINYALVLWGSAEAIEKWHEFQMMSKSMDSSMSEQQKLLWTFSIINKLAELVKIIRRDLGHVDKDLSLATIADLYIPINDKDETLQRIFQVNSNDAAPPSSPN